MMRETEEEFGWYVGLDWGNVTHAVDVGDADGAAVKTRVVEHTAKGIAEFLDWLAQVTEGRWERVAVAIELPRGTLVETLLERGAAVFTLNPKQVDRFRDRFSVAGAKDDTLDALVLRSALRTDRQCFRRLTIEGPRLIRLRELGRADEDLARDFSRLTNRLREQVHRIAPEWLTLSPGAGDPWFWTVLEEAAPFGRRRTMTRRAVSQILRQHRIRRVTAAEVLAVLTRPQLTVAPGTVEAVVRHVALLLPRLKLVQAQRRQCARDLTTLLEELAEEPAAPVQRNDGPGDGASPPPNDVSLMDSLPGIGLKVITGLLSEAGQLLSGRDYLAVRAVSGVAPVRRQTGKCKKGRVGMRYACNQRLRQACYHWANCSLKVDAAARAYYAKLRARGHSHGRALRSVADRWLRILIAMLKHRTLYDPTRFSLNTAQPVTTG